MAFNGSGTFNPLTAPTFPAVSGSVIFANRFNANLADIHQGLSNCITRDGQSPATDNLPMGGHKLTGLAAGSANGDSVRYEQLTSLSDSSMQMRGEIDSATDLDTLTSSGSYTITVLTECDNFPTDGAGIEEVTEDNATLIVVKGVADASMVSQTLVTETGRMFIRSYLEAWSDWSEVNAPGSSLAGSTDFDDLVTTGDYFISNSNITTCTNRPYEYVGVTLTDVTEGGMLRVVARGDRYMQCYITSSAREYSRFYQGGSWTPWAVRFPTTYSGTFTPSLTAGSGTTGISYTLRTGSYWRMGPLIFFSAVMQFSHDGSWSELRLNVPVTPINYSVYNNGPLVQVGLNDTVDTTIGSFYAKWRAGTASEALKVVGFAGIDVGQEIEIDGNIPASTCILTYSGWYVATDNA